mgnify:CR=1 FL=1
MLTMRQFGVSLIELMIGLAILGFLLALGMPAFNLWIQNTQNRTAAESISNGLQLARAEAVRRNALVRFDLTDATGLVAWNVGCVSITADCPAAIQSRPAAEGGVNARAGISTGAIPSPTPAGHFGTAIEAGTGLTAGVSFNGLGRVPSANIGADITRIDITNAATADARRFVVTIGPGGQIRMCDPALVFANNSQGCS